MEDKRAVFLDTNVLVYAVYGTSRQRQQISALIMPYTASAIVSTQVLKEFANVSIKKKLHKTLPELKEHLRLIQQSFKVFDISYKTVISAVDLADKHQYSFYDSLIIAAALENKCNILFSEDLQHGQNIGNKLKIVNPFK